MAYLWLKALHVAAVVTWIGGMLTVALALTQVRIVQGRGIALDAVRRWDRRVTSPAMGLAWVFGLLLAQQGGWFTAPWLSVKLLLVLLLSALHGYLSGSLRRVATDDSYAVASVVHRLPFAILAGVLAIAVLVIVKPI